MSWHRLVSFSAIALSLAVLPVSAQMMAAGDVGPAFAESSAAVLAGALAMASVEPSTGVFRAGLSLQAPVARGISQPDLGLVYSSADGVREAGMGWGLTLPSIERRGPANRTPDDYEDPPVEPVLPADFVQRQNTLTAHREKQIKPRFVFNGEAIVPVCEVESVSSPCPAEAGPIPDWAGKGWLHYRLEHDATGARFFWSPDRLTWVIQQRGGTLLEFGRPLTLAMSGADASHDDDVYFDRYYDGYLLRGGRYRFNLVRRIDAPTEGPTRNLVVYSWRKIGNDGRSYLTDVYYTLRAGKVAMPVGLEDAEPKVEAEDFAHHLRLQWEQPAQIRNAVPPIWRATPDFHLARVDVTSKEDAREARRLVRRYHLGYDNRGHRAFLNRFEMEGRCAAPVFEVGGNLPTTTCPRLPATTLSYSPLESNRLPTSLLLVPSQTLRPGRKSMNLVPLDINGDSRPDLMEVDPEQTDFSGPGLPDRRMYLYNGVWYEHAPIKTDRNHFSKVGYSITGDFSSTGETGLIWYLPPLTGGFGPNTFVPRLGAAGWEWQPGPSPGGQLGSVPRFKLVGDINGDGIPDILDYRDEHNFGDGPPPTSDLKRRASLLTASSQRTSNPAPSWRWGWTCMGPSFNDMLGGWEDGSRSVHLADMNGDSLADLVVIGRYQVRYWPSDGRGNFTACHGAGCTCTTPTSSATASAMVPHDPGADPSSGNNLLADLNGDGYADLVSWNRRQVRISFNNDGWSFRDPVIIESYWFDIGWAQAYDDKAITMSVADMNGNGVADLVVSSGGNTSSLDLHRIISVAQAFAPDASATRPDLLTEIDNGYGARTQIAYRSTAELASQALYLKAPWPEPLPQTMHVVQRVTTKSDLPDAKPMRTYFEYDDPAWDGWQRRLRGFRKVTVTRGVESQASSIQTYFLPSCPDRFCGSTDQTFGRLNAASGRLLVSEVMDRQNRYLSTVSHSHEVREILQGIDGRGIRTAFTVQTDTRLYDTNDWDPIESTAPQTIALQYGDKSETLWTGRVPVRARHSVLMRVSAETDPFGTVIRQTEHGRIRDDGAAIDDPIVTHTKMMPPRPDWRFLPERTRTDPFPARPGIAPDRERHVFYQYDGAGRLRSAHAVLTGVLPLDRFHEDPTAAVAPPPPQASYTAPALLALYSYDDYGNVVRLEAPAGSCATFVYDTHFAELLERRRVHHQGCPNSAAFESETRWDRGLQQVLTQREPSGAISTSSYDGLGRLVEARMPDPTTGAPTNQPSLTVQYLGAAGAPIQRIRVAVQLDQGRSHVVWSYLDGFGREFLTLRQADKIAGDSGAWVASGLPELSSEGFIKALPAPWFYDGDPASHPMVPPPLNPATTLGFDSFGRVTEIRRADGSLAGRRTWRPLRLDSEDAAGRWRSVSLDGHGRLIEQRNRIEAVETYFRVDYQVGGEPTRIIRDRERPNNGLVLPGTPTGIVRWMQYDSLGRLVLNAEPNSATGFKADPTIAGGMKAWRYVYGWDNQLVGTSDARGCGWNLHYDHLRRLVAKDVSPCLRSHPPYTAPDLATGKGTEAFYSYDQPEPGLSNNFGASAATLVGRLVSLRDRAAHTKFAYDARGRIVELARRLTKPADMAGNWPDPMDIDSRYAGDWFRTVNRYDNADRRIAASTGAVASELLDSQGKSEILLSYGGRGLITAIGGSYGTLVAGITYDALGRQVTRRLGDVAETLLTTGYRRAGSIEYFKASRAPPVLWVQGGQGYAPPPAGAPPTTQALLESFTYGFDTAGMLTSVTDHRSPSDWPDGFKPVSRTFEHDPAGRVSRIDYIYPGGIDTRPPGTAGDIPHALVPQRPGFQAFGFDTYGNASLFADDAGALFDRALGGVVTGGLAGGPNRLVSAGGGQLQARHDAAGNLVSITVRRTNCAAPSGLCSHRFVFDWDEVGQLARARRWDYVTIPAGEPDVPPSPPVADLRYRYDGPGARVLLSAIGADGVQKHAAWPLPMLRLEDATFDNNSGYTRTAATEEIAVPGVACILYRTGLPGPSPQRVLLPIQDHLGSTSTVIDRDTGELVERLTYLAHGAAETEYRPARWAGLSARERFTGKEEDPAIGLTYFGRRYLFPRLGQWISPDPLTIHGLGADLNPYSYVGGRVAMVIDRHGLQPCIGMEWYGACAGSGGGASNGGFQIGFGKPEPGSSSGGDGGSRRPSEPYSPPPIPKSPPDAGWRGSSATVPFWQALGDRSMWSSRVDPSVIEGFNAGVRKNEGALVGTGLIAAAQGALVGGMAGYEIGAGMLAGAGHALRSFGAAVYVNAARAAQFFSELSLAEQGITVGGTGATGLALSRVERAQQIYRMLVADVPYMAKSTVGVADLARPNGVTVRVITANDPRVLQWMRNNITLTEFEHLVEGAAHAELNAASWGLRNGFTHGQFGTSSRGCPNCIQDLELNFNQLPWVEFLHDNPQFSIIDILLNPTWF